MSETPSDNSSLCNNDSDSTESYLRILNQFALSLIDINNVDDLVWHVAVEVVGKLDFVDCVIYLADLERDVLVQSAAIGEKSPEKHVIINKLEIPIGKGITGTVAKTRKPIILADTSADDRYIDDLDEFQSEICVPMVHEGELIGVIDSEHPQIGYFNQQHLEILKTIAAFTSVKIIQCRIQNRLRAQASVIRQVSEAVLVFGVDGIIVDCNTAAEVLYEYETLELIGTRVRELLSKNVNFEVLTNEIMQSVAQFGFWKGQIAINNINTDGNEMMTEVSVTKLIDDKIDDELYIAVTRDISELVERTIQLESKTEELKKENLRRIDVEEDLHEALEEARKASAAKSSFLSVMSHELRTPMNAIIGALQIIQDEPLTNNQGKLVETAKDAGDFLVNLLTDVLDISKIESDGVTIHYRDLSIRPFMRKFERQISVLVEAAGCSWNMTIDRHVPDLITMDVNRLQQILTNFVGNACKYAPDSLIHVKIYMQSPEVIIFCVEDTGQGIAIKDLCRIFEPFNQVDSELNRKTSGVGLGLSICKRLSEAMGGTCEADSKLGEGSKFYLRLPCNTAQQKSQVQAHKDKINAENDDDFEQKDILRIMLVDDSEINQLIAKKMLEKRGHKVVSIMNGYDAIDASKTKRFDVILMDLQMPEMDGLTAARKIIEINGINRNTPIIPMTANVGSEFEIQTADAGMTGFIPKPVNPDTMLDSIYLALRESHMANNNYVVEQINKKQSQVDKKRTD